jgi:hypothetical protein
MALTTASNSAIGNTEDWQRVLPVARFLIQYGIDIEELSTEQYRVKMSQPMAGFDTSRAYPTFDLAVLAVLQHAATAGYVNIGATGSGDSFARKTG